MDARIYDRMAEVEERHWWFASRRDIVEKILGRLGLPKDAAILEAGCGTGGNLKMLAHHGRVYAMEPFEAARTIASSLGAAKIADGSLPNEIPFADLSFDLILMTDVLEHLDDDVASLVALRQRVKPVAGFWRRFRPCPGCGASTMSRITIDVGIMRRVCGRLLRPRVSKCAISAITTFYSFR